MGRPLRKQVDGIVWQQCLGSWLLHVLGLCLWFLHPLLPNPEWMYGWTDGRTDGRKEGRKDGWMDGWMDGWLDASLPATSMIGRRGKKKTVEAFLKTQAIGETQRKAAEEKP